MARFSLTDLTSGSRRRRHDGYYQPSLKGIVGSVAYSLTQQSARLDTRRAAVCPMTRQLARLGTHQTVLYKAIPYSLKDIHI